MNNTSRPWRKQETESLFQYSDHKENRTGFYKRGIDSEGKIFKKNFK